MKDRASTWQPGVTQGEDLEVIYCERQPDGSYMDFTDYEFAGQVRRTPASSIAATYQFDVIDHPNTGDSNAALRIRILKAVTVGMAPGRYSHDVFSTPPGGLTERILKGFLDVKQRVTRND